MMLHGRDDNLIARLKMLPTIRLGNKVDRLGSTSYEDDLASIPCTDEALYRLTGRFIDVLRVDS